MTDLNFLQKTYGLTRSLVMYYGIPGRSQRMQRFYSQLVSHGDLAFDIGAHVGNRTRTFVQLGCRVVALEPQDFLYHYLVKRLGRYEGVSLRKMGVGSRVEELEMLISEKTPTVSSFSKDWVDEVTADPRFRKIVWNERQKVKMTTLDSLITEFGVPKFCKIDVEGFEGDVLKGLSQPLPQLSFEYIPIARGKAIDCLDTLTALGDYRFNYSVIETMKMVFPKPVSANEMTVILEKMPDQAGSGDVYAFWQGF